MNSKERVFSVVSGKIPDRPPLSLTLGLYGQKLIQSSPEKYYTDYKEFVRGQTAVIETIEPDILFSPFTLAYEGAAFGYELTYLNHGVPNIKKPAFKDIESALKLKLPNLDTSWSILFVRNALQRLKQEYGNSFPIAGIVTSPIDLPILFLGLDKWLETVLFDEENMKKILKISSEFFIKYANTLISDGADLIVIPAAFCNPKIITRAIIEKITLPLFKESFPKIKAPIVIHSGGSIIGPFMDYYIEMPNVAAFAISSKDTFPDIRKTVEKERLLMGNLEGPALCMLKEQAIEKICHKILEDTQDDPHFIFATAAADIAYETDLNKILLVKKIMSGAK